MIAILPQLTVNPGAAAQTLYFITAKQMANWPKTTQTPVCGGIHPALEGPNFILF
jgi:hypothetical protein